VSSLEGESGSSERDNSKAISNESVEEDDVDIATEPVEEKGKRFRKESEYVRMLRDGTGTTGAWSKSNPLPQGMQPGDKAVIEEESAMATVIESAEGLMPTYDEAVKRPDWPKWEAAINNELNSLKMSGTWELVKRPPDANVVDCR
jgi:hypothetical protein